MHDSDKRNLRRKFYRRRFHDRRRAERVGRNDYPFRPGTKAGSPETAFAAARFVDAWNRQQEALMFLSCCGTDGATCDEVAAGCGWDERYSSRPRLSELRKLGAIAASGRCRRGVSGRWQTVWVLVAFAPHGPLQGELFDMIEAMAGRR